MRQRTWKARVKKVLTEERAEPIQWHYCSFADEVFRGAIIIEGHGITDICLKTHALGINPGGEMLCHAIPEEVPIPPEQYRNRLLTKEEVQEFWPETKSLKEWEAEETKETQ